MKYSEIEEIIRRVVKERKLTKAEEKKKEKIAKGMKKSFTGDKSDMYAIATARAMGKVKKEELQAQSDKKEIVSEPYAELYNLIEKLVAQNITKDEILRIVNFATAKPNKSTTSSELNKIFEGGDHEVSMAVSSLEAIADSIIELRQKLGNQERNIPGWIQDHIAKAENYIEQAAQGFHELNESMLSNNFKIYKFDSQKENELLSILKLAGDRGKKMIDFIKANPDKIDMGSMSKATSLQVPIIVKHFNELVSKKVILPTDSKMTEEKDPLDVVVSEKKARDLTGDNKIDSADYLKARDIAIKKAQDKKK